MLTLKRPAAEGPIAMGAAIAPGVPIRTLCTADAEGGMQTLRQKKPRKSPLHYRISLTRCSIIHRMRRFLSNPRQRKIVFRP